MGYSILWYCIYRTPINSSYDAGEVAFMKERKAEEFYSAYANEPAVLLGNGPSLLQVKDKWQVLNRKFITIGMNRSWEVYPNPNHHAVMFHYEHLEDLKMGKWVPSPGCTVWAYKHYCEMWLRDVRQGNVIYVPSVAEPDNPMHEFNLAGLISCDLTDASYADMTGMFALEIALWMRCNPIYLIGYDLYGGHFNDKLKPEQEWREIQVELFELTAAQIEIEFSWAKVYNLSKDSAIEGFEKVDIEEVLR